MAITNAGFDGTVDEVQAARMSFYQGAESAFAGDADFKPKPVTTADRTMQFAAGEAFGDGVLTKSDAVINLSFDSVSSGSRWDTVVLRRDWQPVTGTTTLMVLKGTATKMIAASRLTNKGVQSDQLVALVRLQAGQSLPQEFVDLRTFPSKITLARDLLALPSPALGATVQLVDGAGVLGPRYIRRLDSSGNPSWASTTQARRYECRMFDSDGFISIASDYTWTPQLVSPVVNTLGCTNSGRSIVVPRDGVYHIDVNFQWLGGAGAGRVKAMIWLNPTSDAIPGSGKTSPDGGTSIRNATYGWAPVAQDVTASKVYPLVAGDRLMFSTYQDTGQSQKLLVASTTGGFSSSCYVSIDLLGDS